MEEKPIEVYCPICGYTTLINVPENSLSGLSRDDKVSRLREIQHGPSPFYTCSGCKTAKDAAAILEIR